MGLLRTTAKGMAWTTVSTVVRSLVSMLQVAILTRFLSKSDFGIVAIANLFIGFTQIFLDLGLSVGIMHKQDTTPKQYSSLFWLNIICGITLTAILVAISPLVAKYYKEPSLSPILMLLSLTIFLSSIGSQHRTVQQKKMRFKVISVIEIISSVLTLLVAYLLVKFGCGIYSLVWSTLFHVALTNIVFLLIGLRSDKNISFHFNIRDTYPFLKIGVYSIGTHVLDYFSRETDIIIISATLGKDVLGVYSLCKKLVVAIYSAVNPIILKVLTPILSQIQNDLNHVRQVYFNLIESLALTNFPIYFLVAIFSCGLLNFIYGPDYVEARYVLSLLAIYYGILSTGNPIGSLQTALGRTDTGFYWTICRIIIYTITIYVGSLFNLTSIVLFLIIVNIIVTPLAWRITIRPLLGGTFFPFFRLTIIPLVFTALFSIPFYFWGGKYTNVPLCISLGVVYSIIYVLLISVLFKKTYLVIKVRELSRHFKSKPLTTEASH